MRLRGRRLRLQRAPSRGGLAGPAGDANLHSVECWQPAPQVIWSVEDDLAVLLSLDTGQYHALNDVAGRIWCHLVEGLSVPEVALAEAREYDALADLDTVTEDVHTTIAELERRRLVTPVGGHH